MKIKAFTAQRLNRLSDMAKISTRRRKHQNLHKTFTDGCQRLFNAIELDSYIRPHCHGPDQGEETIFAIKGLMALVVFNETGCVDQIVYFGDATHHTRDDVAVGVEISPGTWHTVVAIEPGSVLLELKAGPFNPSMPKFPALWAPEEEAEASLSYLAKLRSLILSGFVKF